MNQPPVLRVHICPYCGAASDAHATNCWLCKEGTSISPYAVSGDGSEAGTSPAIVPWNTQDKIAAAVLVGTVALTALIVVGLAVQDSGLILPLAIIVGPAYCATAIRASVQSNSKQGINPSKLFSTFLLSFVLTIVTIMMLFVALFVAVLVICTSSLGR